MPKTKKTPSTPAQPNVKKAAKPQRGRPTPNRLAGYTQDMQARRKFEAKVSKEATNAVLPLMGQGRPQETNKARIKDIKQHATLVPRLDGWLKLLARPFANPIVKCPINYNPVPSFMTSLARTTITDPNVTVDAGQCLQYAIFGGHGLSSETASMDGVAYHARQQTIGAATNYSIGPMGLTGLTVPAIGVRSFGMAVGGARALSNTIQDLAMTYDVALPYLATGSESGHSRWKLVAMGARFENMTAMNFRGGNIVTVQPSNKGTFGVDPTTQAAMASNPSFTISEEANSGTLERSWIPRPEDLGFWHTMLGTEESAIAALNHAGLFIWINNPTSSAQQYEVQFVFHWELSGSYLNAVSSPSIHQPADKNIVEPVIDLSRFTASGAQHVVDFAKHVAGNVGPMRAGAVPILSGNVSSAAKLLLDTMA